MKQVNIYALINPINGQVFYVGATSSIPKNRLVQHLLQSKKDNTTNNRKVELIKSITNQGLMPELLLLDIVSIPEASFYEEFYIGLFKSYGFDLLQKPNSTFSNAYKEGWNAKRSREETPETTGITFRIGRIITEIRKEEGLTQLQLADKLNISPSVISAIENGRRNICFDTLGNIATALNRVIAPKILFKP